MKYNIEIEASKKFEVFDVSFQFMSSIQNAKTMNNQAKALQKPEKGMFCKAVAKSNENKADQLIETQRNRNHWRNAKDDLPSMCLHAPTNSAGNTREKKMKAIATTTTRKLPILMYELKTTRILQHHSRNVKN